MIIRGVGYVQFTAGSGVAFYKGGQQNTSTAFYDFTSSQIGSLFDPTAGEISFSLTSPISFAELQMRRVAFEVYDESKLLYSFVVEPVSNRMVFYYNAGGTGTLYYYVPIGQEDVVLGKGVTARFRLTWNGSTASLYINDLLVNSSSYTPAVANWTAASSFTIGSQNTHVNTGGYFASDIAISSLRVANRGAGRGISTVPALSGITCTPGTVSTPALLQCTVSLTGPTAAAVSIGLSSTSPAILLPATITIPAGASTAAVSVSVTQVSTTETATVRATDGTVSATTTVTLKPSASLAGVTCSPAKTALATTSCTVTVASPSASSVFVSLTSSSTDVVVPAAVTIPAGAMSVSFTASTASRIATRTATVTATVSGSSQSTLVTLLTPEERFRLVGVQSEVAATITGAPVTPPLVPSGLPGKLTIRGVGSVLFAAGKGVGFYKGGQQNSNTAFYNFTGSQLGAVFASAGEISFSLASPITATALKDRRIVYEAYDNTNRLFAFSVEPSSNTKRLAFSYSAGSTTTLSYTLPAGQEEALLGKGVTARIRIVWNASTVSLYVNGQLVKTDACTLAVPNWAALSSWTVGAQSTHTNTGGSYASDIAISDVSVVMYPAI
jgi:hypothetical protein